MKYDETAVSICMFPLESLLNGLIEFSDSIITSFEIILILRYFIGRFLLAKLCRCVTKLCRYFNRFIRILSYNVTF